MMTPKGILKDSSRSKLSVSFSHKEIILKSYEKPPLKWSKNSALQQTKQSLSSSISFVDTHKILNTDKKKAKASIDLWYPLKKYDDDRYTYQNPQIKAFQHKKLKTMTSLSTDTSNFSSSFTSIFSASNIIWKNKRGQINRVNTQTSVKPASNNFISSFRIVFSQLVEAFFLQLYLKKKIRYLTYQIWVNIINKTQSEQKDFHKIDIKTFCTAIKNIFGNDYRLSQIQNMTLRYFPECDLISYQQFQDTLTVQSEFVDFLMERSYQKRFSNFPPSKLVNAFLKSMIEFADLEKKLKLICKANESQAIKIMMQICSGKTIKTSKFAAFLDEQNAQKIAFGQKLSEQKLANFLDKILQRKTTKFDLMKWLQIVEG